MTFKITSLIAAVLIIAACHTTKKTSSTTTTTPPVAPISPEPSPAPKPKPSNGVIVPSEDQLTAIKTKFPDATLSALTEGHAVYISAACTNCHGIKGIYRIPEHEWQHIIDDMSARATLTASQKDALTKYVFAIKATQPPSVK